MALASLYFANKTVLWPVTLATAVALAFVGWTYVRTPAPPALRLGCAVLKLCGLLALLALPARTDVDRAAREARRQSLRGDCR